MKRSILPLLLFAGTIFAGGDYFQDISLADALVKAKKENKIVFVDFYTTWCGPCKLMDRTTFKDESVKAWLTNNTIPLKIDAEEKVELAKKYKVSGYPYLAFIGADGTLDGSLLGYRKAKEFIKDADKVLSGKSPIDEAKENLAKDPSFRNHLNFAKAQVEEEEYVDAMGTLKQILKEGAQGNIDGYSDMGVYMTISRMGRKHEPAKTFLIETRDELRSKILNEGEEKELPTFSFLNSLLRDSEDTLAVYDKIKATNPGDERLKAFGNLVFSELLAANRYAEIVAIEEVDQRIEKINLQSEELKKGPMADRAEGMQIRRLCDQFQILMGLDRKKEAEALANKILDINKDAETYNGLAWSGFLSGATDESTVTYAKKADELSEYSSAAIIDTLVRVLHAMGQKEEAFKVLDERLAKFPKQGRERSILIECRDDLKADDSEKQKQG